MKSYKALEKKYKPDELAESYVFPHELNAMQKTQTLTLFREWRKKNESKRSVNSKLVTKLLQLKYLMEDYVKQHEYREELDFSYFLLQYIDRLEMKRKEFAQEIDVDPTELSQIINRHRPPNEKFIIRLELHSNKNFPAVVWYKILEKERAFHLQNNSKIRLVESKHVKPKLNFTF